MKYRLKEVIKKNNDSLKDLAVYLDISYLTLTKKLNGHVEFNRKEIKNIKERYNLFPDEIDYIFFQE